MNAEAQTPAARLLLALDLCEAGLEMKRATLKRNSPRLTDEELDTLFREWLEKRPEAPFGDSAGSPGSLERFTIGVDER